MAVDKFKADIEAADRKAAARQELNRILEWRLGKFHLNQAIINDIDAAGLLKEEKEVDLSFLLQQGFTVRQLNSVSTVLRMQGIIRK